MQCIPFKFKNFMLIKCQIIELFVKAVTTQFGTNLELFLKSTYKKLIT